MQPTTYRLLTSLIVASFASACGGSLECGLGTVEVDGACQPGETVCGTGTMFVAEASVCVPTETGSLTCGPGTRVESGQCVPDGVGGLSCGVGTVQSMDGTSCVPAPEACGPGTTFDAATRECISDTAVTCGPGTAEMNGECLPTPDVCGPGTVFSPVTSSCIRGEAFFGDCANPMAIDGASLGRIEGDVVLAAGGCFEVTAPITIQGTLRIEPGVTVVFQENTGFLVNGTLSAVGTAMSPVLMRGATSQPGYWNGLQYSNSNQTENRLEHVTIRHGGGSAFRGRRGCLVVQEGGSASLESRISLSNLTIEDCQGFGLDTDDTTFDAFEQVTISSAEQGPLSLPANVVGQLTANSNLTGNTVDFVDVRGGAVFADATWPTLDVPYRLSANLDVSARLELSAGMTIRVAENVEWMVTQAGTLVSVGGPSRTTIQGDIEVPGSWSGIIYAGSNRIENLLEQTDVAHGGGTVFRGLQANIVLSDVANNSRARVTLRNVTLSQSAGYGIASDDRVDLVFEQNTIRDSALGVARVPFNVAPAFDGQSTYVGNAVDRIIITASQLSDSARLAATEVPYLAQGELIVSNGATLTLSPGTTMRFAENARLTIRSAALTAIGTPGAPIELIGEVGTVGYWDGVLFETSDRIANRLENVRIAHAGRTEYRGLQGNLILRGIPSTLSEDVRIELVNVSLEDGAAAGIAVATPVFITACVGVTFSNVVNNAMIDNQPAATICSP